MPNFDYNTLTVELQRFDDQIAALNARFVALGSTSMVGGQPAVEEVARLVDAVKALRAQKAEREQIVELMQRIIRAQREPKIGAQHRAQIRELAATAHALADDIDAYTAAMGRVDRAVQRDREAAIDQLTRQGMSLDDMNRLIAVANAAAGGS